MYITFLLAGTGKTMLAKEWKNIKVQIFGLYLVDPTVWSANK
jgi:hypothetical protein